MYYGTYGSQAVVLRPIQHLAVPHTVLYILTTPLMTVNPIIPSKCTLSITIIFKVVAQRMEIATDDPNNNSKQYMQVVAMQCITQGLSERERPLLSVCTCIRVTSNGGGPHSVRLRMILCLGRMII